jgi:DNA-binding transcriptional ArsR family regulator
MAFSKANQFADPMEINHNISNYAKALSYPARVIIVRWLAEEGKKSAGEISAHIGLSMSTTSHHLACLVKVGFISGHEQGRNIYYSFNHLGFQMIQSFFEEVFGELSERAQEIAETEEGQAF